MNVNKHVKPNLLDPIIEKKIVKTLNGPDNDYWAPAKTTAASFFDTYIRPHIVLVIFIALIILFLIYRYRMIKSDREIKRIEEEYAAKYSNYNTYVGKNTGGPNIPARINKNIQAMQTNYVTPTQPTVPAINTDLLLQYYNQQKELSREPTQKSCGDHTNVKQSSQKNAYPIYPYDNGILTPTKKTTSKYHPTNAKY